MDSHRLENASQYLNNLLLARGLLRNGKSINFAHQDQSSGVIDSTVVKVVNLVHDLVLRRDREAEQRDVLAENARKIRADEAQKIIEIDRLHSRNEECARSLSHAEAQQRALKSSLRKAEKRASEMQEQIRRMKSTIDQVRAKGISDIQKRDVELKKLKSHIAELQKGQRGTPGTGPTIAKTRSGLSRAKGSRQGQDSNSADWILENENNEMLAALVHEASLENVSLRSIIGNTLGTLRQLMGLDQEHVPQRADRDGDGIGIPGQYRKSRQQTAEPQDETIVPCDSLAANMDELLGHCRAILRDPSFVSIEEVQIREDEIIKLREGWMKMANRWKEAVTMMDMWRKRIIDGGESVNLDELSHLGLDTSVAVLPRREIRPSTGLHVSSARDGDDNDADDADVFVDSFTGEITEPSSSASAVTSHDKGSVTSPADEDQYDSASEFDHNVSTAPSSPKPFASPARRGLKLPRPAQVLGETSANARQASPEAAFGFSLDRSTESASPSFDGSGGSEQGSYKASEASHISSIELTVPEKLAAIEKEAQAAKVLQLDDSNMHERPRTLSQRKAHRRKSTLSPEELETLMSGG